MSFSKTLSTYQLKGNSDRDSVRETLISWLCPQASHTHDAISEAAQLMKEAVDDIMVTLNEAASEGGMVGGMVESIAEAMGRVSKGVFLLLLLLCFDRECMHCMCDTISWEVCSGGSNWHEVDTYSLSYLSETSSACKSNSTVGVLSPVDEKF